MPSPAAVHPPVRRVVDGVGPGERAGAVRELDDRGRVRDRAERVRGERDRDHPRARADERGEVLHVERAVAWQESGLAHHEPVILRDAQPGGDVRVVIELRRDDLVAGRERAAEGVHELELERRRVRAERDLAGIRTEQVGGRRARLVQHRVGLDARREGAAAVRVRPLEVADHAVDHGLRHLRARRAVEVDERAAVRPAARERRELRAEVVDGERLRCGGGHPRSLVARLRAGAAVGRAGASALAAAAPGRAAMLTAMSGPVLDRNIALELVRVTEMAALAAARWVGRGDKKAADQAAVDAMRQMLSTVQMDGLVVIGEGEKDEAPMLYNGEHVGDGSAPQVDVAVDPLGGTTLTAKGMPNAVAVIALSDRGTMFDPGPCVYMEKMAGAEDIADLLSLDDPIEDVLARVAERRRVKIRDLAVVILDRPRHEEMIGRIREAGARIRLISDGDVAGVLMAVLPGTGADLLWGVGGTPEGVIAAAAVRSTGGALLGRMWPRDADERAATIAAGIDVERVLGTDDLVASDNCVFAATGVTGGDFLKGVTFDARGAVTHSLVMRGRSGTVRTIEARHVRSKLTWLMEGQTQA